MSIKDHTEIKPLLLTKSILDQIYNNVERSLNFKLSTKGKKILRKDINRYLLINNNDVNKTLEHFKNYKENLKKIYLGYSEETLNNLIIYLYK